MTYDQVDNSIKDFENKVGELENKFKDMATEKVKEELQRLVVDDYTKLDKMIDKYSTSIHIPNQEHIQKRNELRSRLDKAFSRLNSMRHSL